MSQYSESATSRFALIDDQGLSLNIHYHDCGEGEEVVVMLHGSGPGASGWSNFSRNVEPLTAAGYRVVLMDCPGWSKSDSIVCSDSRSALNRSEEHTSELQSRPHLVCRLLLEKKKKITT